MLGEYRIIMLMQRKIAEFEGLRVMLVEDDVLLAMEMEDLLGDMGCEVVGPFGKLPDALDAADRERFDGVLLDLNLRGELSFPLLDKLLGQNVPVVVCSGYVDLPGMNERLAEVPCLAKPCNIETLVSLMRQHFLDRASPSRQSAEKDSSHTRPVSG